MVYGVLFPSSNHINFLVKYIFTLNTKSPDNLLHPGGGFSVSASNSKSMPTFGISLSIVSHQKLLPLFVSIYISSSAVVGNSIPCLWVVFMIQCFSVDKMTYLFRRVYVTHHAKSGSSETSLALTNSAI